jgi:methionyl-tRNA synthetase
MLYLKPVVPSIAARAEAFMGLPEQRWSDAGTPLVGTTLKAYEPLATRVDPAAVKALLAAAAQSLQPSDNKAAPAQATAAAAASASATIGIDDFAKLDLRIARIVAADHVDGADKLLRLTVDLGGEERQVFAGIRSAYDPATLVASPSCSRISSRARCDSACRRAWCSRPARAAPRSSCCRPTRAPRQA